MLRLFSAFLRVCSQPSREDVFSAIFSLTRLLLFPLHISAHLGTHTPLTPQNLICQFSLDVYKPSDNHQLGLIDWQT